MKLNEFLKSDKGIKLAIIAGLAVMVLIFLTSLMGGKNEEPSSQNTATTLINVDESTRLAEERLAQILSEIQGVGEIHVMITLDKSEESVYADKDEVSATITPTVRGVVVVSSGCSNITVREKVSEAVVRALGIGANRVCVTY